MFFHDLTQIPQIAQRTSCAVFVVPPDSDLHLQRAIFLRPNDGSKTATIGVEQVREFMALANNREVNDRFFVITPADAMNEPAQNALLKTLEEPGAYCHFVLVTLQPNLLLPTILSRAQIFVLKPVGVLDQPPSTDPKLVNLAKRMLAATPAQLPALAAEIAKIKDQPREHALMATAIAIELLYKSYFKTKESKFLTKLPKFLALHQHLSQNGHLKLHIVADLA